MEDGKYMHLSYNTAMVIYHHNDRFGIFTSLYGDLKYKKKFSGPYKVGQVCGTQQKKHRWFNLMFSGEINEDDRKQAGA